MDKIAIKIPATVRCSQKSDTITACEEELLLSTTTKASQPKGVSMRSLTLSLMPQKYAVCELQPNGHIPTWALIGDFVSLTRTDRELSVVCMQENVPDTVQGSFDFSLAGVHVSLAIPLAEANISILAIATYATDYLLIQEKDLARATQVLRDAGHTFQPL
jgi:uncharacterized protein